MGRPTNHSSSQKNRLSIFSDGIKNLDRSFFRFITLHAFDRQPNGRTDTILIARLRLHCMLQRGKNENSIDSFKVLNQWRRQLG